MQMSLAPDSPSNPFFFSSLQTLLFFFSTHTFLKTSTAKFKMADLIAILSGPSVIPHSRVPPIINQYNEMYKKKFLPTLKTSATQKDKHHILY